IEQVDNVAADSSKDSHLRNSIHQRRSGCEAVDVKELVLQGVVKFPSEEFPQLRMDEVVGPMLPSISVKVEDQILLNNPRRNGDRLGEVIDDSLLGGVPLCSAPFRSVSFVLIRRQTTERERN